MQYTGVVVVYFYSEMLPSIVPVDSSDPDFDNV